MEISLKIDLFNIVSGWDSINSHERIVRGLSGWTFNNINIVDKANELN